MQNKQPHPKSTTKPFVLAIATAVVMLVAFISILTFTNHHSGSDGQKTGPGQMGNNVGSGSSDCSTGGPCTNSNNSAAGCASSGPCTQSSNGQTLIPGKVVAISSTSITIKPTNGGSNETFTITPSTKENKGGNTADVAFNVGDIAVGSGVGIVLSSTNSNQAELVMLNLQAQMETGSGNAAAH
ncbi:MAG TPA: hypothetical protein VJR27_00585 [Candidatus Saccharimonadales bacterium]|nr:hypothetical protein [Candidatus Saccharimonadales bacterium]